MEEAGTRDQAVKLGLAAGGLFALVLLRRWMRRRKIKKILKARARMKARLEKSRAKEAKAEKGRRRAGKKGRERSMAEQLIRFAVFQFLKKIISEQIKQTQLDLGKGRLGKKLVGAPGEA